MEHFIVSARKYRPATFKDVVGQQAITNTLENAIANDHLAQALLFTGPRGVGKTTCARILAKRINQAADDTPPSVDEDYAFNIFELDAASNNSVDDIRNLIDQVRIPPQVGHYKVYIIDEVHMLSQAAFNAFLKTLEEPPKHAIFILATTEKHKIIPTILSRCQIFDFKRITVKDIREHLMDIAQQEGVNAEEEGLHIIAQKADGALRDALSTFDRVVSFSGKNLTRKAVTENLNVLDYDTYFEVTHLILGNNIPELLLDFNDILAQGFDGHHFIAGLASHLRDLMVAKRPETLILLEVGDQTKKQYGDQAAKAPMDFLLKALEMANDCDLKYRTSRNPRLLVELCLMQLASITFDGEKKNSKNYIVPPTFYKEVATRPDDTNSGTGLGANGDIASAKENKASETSETQKTANLPPSALSADPNPSAVQTENKTPVKKGGKLGQNEKSIPSNIPLVAIIKELEASPANVGATAPTPMMGLPAEENINPANNEQRQTSAIPTSVLLKENKADKDVNDVLLTASRLDEKTKPQDQNPEQANRAVDQENEVEIKKQNLPKENTSPVNQNESLKEDSVPVDNINKLNLVEPHISSLSIKGLQKKKEIEQKRENALNSEAKKPTDPFTEIAMLAAWKEYSERMERKGEKIMASNLDTDVPKLKGTTIHLEFPNETMKVELERAQHQLLEFLKRKLNNYDIDLKITVNEQAQGKHAFTPREKFEKLNAINPNLELLLKTFDLDL